MILTLTPNPTIDRVIFVHNFRLGTVVRAEREVVTPSGKGIDASLVIHELGGATVATGLNAGFTGRLLASLLDERGITHDFVPAQGETRTAAVLVDLAVNEQSTITAPTLTATAEHLSRLLTLLDHYAEQSWGVICAGSLPPGLPPDSYAHLLRHARRRGLVTLLDTSGEALRRGVAGLPHILKINRHELEQLAPEMASGKWQRTAGGHGAVLGSPSMEIIFLSPDDVIELARMLTVRLHEWTRDALIITLGGQGALLVTTEGSYHALPPEVPVVNTAGAGDALSAGILLQRSQGADWPAALRWGVATAASVVMNEGTAICQQEQVEDLLLQVEVTRIE